MAYLSFAPWPTDEGLAVHPSIGPSVGASTGAAEAGAFTAVELRVIALAERKDAIGELSDQSRLGRFLARVFGVPLNRPLANPRLETLRRFVSLARHHPDDLRRDDVEALVGTGFSPGQAAGLVRYFAPHGKS